MFQTNSGPKPELHLGYNMDDDSAVPFSTKAASDVLEECLKNTHESLKWFWQLVMGAALVTAVKEAYRITLDPASTQNYPGWIKIYAIGLLVGAFLPAFVRFYFGDSRYLDLQYLELRRNEDAVTFARELQFKLTKRRRCLDIAILMWHGVLFLLLASSLARPSVFILIYTFLLLTNCILLAISIRHSALRSAPDAEGLSLAVCIKFFLQRICGKDCFNKPVLEIYKAPLFWIANNAFAGFLMGALFFEFYKDEEYYMNLFVIFVALAILNSFLDLYAEREFYLPDFTKTFQDAVVERQSLKSKDYDI